MQTASGLLLPDTRIALPRVEFPRLLRGLGDALDRRLSAMMPLSGMLGPLAAGSRVAPFVPTDIAGLKLWLKADAIVGLSNGDAVGTWTDQSGNGNNATAAAAARPAYKVNILNAKPVVRFDGSDDVLTIADNAGLNLAAGSVFVVFARRSAAGTAGDLLERYGSNATETLNYTTSFNTANVLRSVCANGTSFTVVGTATIVTNAFCLVEFLFANGAAALYKNGSAGGTGTPAFTPGLAPSVNVTIGKGGHQNVNFNGDIAEILLYNSLLSDGNRGFIESYLNSKYALY